MGDLKYEMDEYGNVRAVGGGSAEEHVAALKAQLNKPAAKPPDGKQTGTNNSNNNSVGLGVFIVVFLMFMFSGWRVDNFKLLQESPIGFIGIAALVSLLMTLMSLIVK